MPRLRPGAIRRLVTRWVAIAGVGGTLEHSKIYETWAEAKPFAIVDGRIPAECVFAAWPSKAEAVEYFTAAKTLVPLRWSPDGTAASYARRRPTGAAVSPDGSGQ